MLAASLWESSLDICPCVQLAWKQPRLINVRQVLCLLCIVELGNMSSFPNVFAGRGLETNTTCRASGRVSDIRRRIALAKIRCWRWQQTKQMRDWLVGMKLSEFSIKWTLSVMSFVTLLRQICMRNLTMPLFSLFFILLPLLCVRCHSVSWTLSLVCIYSSMYQTW